MKIPASDAAALQTDARRIGSGTVQRQPADASRIENTVNRYTTTTYGINGRGRTRTYDLTDVNRAL